MDEFRIITPSSLLAPYIKQYWFLTLENIQSISQRLLPFSYTGLYFIIKDEPNIPIKEKNLLSGIYGQQTKYTDFFYSGTVSFIAVIFQPLGIKLLLDMPLDDFTDKVISLNDLNDKDFRELEEQLQEELDCKKRVSLLEKYLLERISFYDEEKVDYRRVYAAINLMRLGENNIREIARHTCLSYKQFKRVFSGYTGINPKDYSRIIRFQRASYFLQTNIGISLEQLSGKSGYYDKSHLIKDFRKYSGYTPEKYLSLCDDYSGYHSLFRSAFLDLP